MNGKKGTLVVALGSLRKLVKESSDELALAPGVLLR